jgi:hypothetical protein
LKQYKLEELARHLKSAISSTGEASAVTRTISTRVDYPTVNSHITAANSSLDDAARHLQDARSAMLGTVRTT